MKRWMVLIGLLASVGLLLTPAQGQFRVGGAGRSVDARTALVNPGESATLSVQVGASVQVFKSIEVQTGCLSYAFGLYQDAGFDPGEELLFVSGQVLNYYDGAPPVLRDTDGTSTVRARFTNTGVMGCEFRLLASGGGF